jgi:Spy/CpxP family protein refolding chaperone
MAMEDMMNHETINGSNPAPKRRWKTAAAGAVLAVGLLAAGSVAVARPFGGKPMFGGPGMMISRALEDLDLTEQQELQAIRIRRSIKEQAKDSREAMRADLDRVVAELEKANPDATKLHAVVDESLARMQKLAHSTVDQYLELHRTLTPEQRTALVERLRNARVMHEEMRHELRDEAKRAKKR